MNLLHKKICKKFDQAIDNYDQTTKIQQIAGKKLINELIKQANNCKFDNILDLGCGTGLTTARLCKSIIFSELNLCDFSLNLLNKASNRLKKYSPKIISMNFDNNWGNLPQFDLIFSNMAMQWSLNLDNLLQNCTKYLNLNGFFIFSMPIKGTFSILIDHGINVNNFYESEHIITNLIKLKLNIKSIKIINYSENYINIHQALRNIKQNGADCTINNHKKSIIDRKILTLPGILDYKIAVFITRKENYDQNIYYRNRHRNW